MGCSGSNHLHTYFGTSAIISTTALSETGVPALFTTFPSTNTLPTPWMGLNQATNLIANVIILLFGIKEFTMQSIKRDARFKHAVSNRCAFI